MARTFDLTGQVFGRLTAVARAENSPSGQARWQFRCVCGTEKVIDAYSVRHGATTSCGCFHREVTGKMASQVHRRHGASRTPDWYRWWSMILRCTDPKNKSFKNYGARGITVCDQWRGRAGFQNYMADMGPRPSPRHSIERLNNAAGYSRENCVWATASDQLRNTRRNRLVEFNGETLPLTDWGIRLGINASTLFHRWARGERGERLLRPTESQGRRPAHSAPKSEK